MRARAILVVLCIACLATGLATGPASVARAEVGRVKKASGEAHVERAGERIDAAPGVTLEVADVLVTGGDGTISVTFIDNSRFSVGPDSRVALDSFEFNATTHEGRFETSIERGSLAIVSGQIADEEPDAMKVRTPTSILGVRGTRFVVEVGG